jgi:homoserine kinase
MTREIKKLLAKSTHYPDAKKLSQALKELIMGLVLEDTIGYLMMGDDYMKQWNLNLMFVFEPIFVS